MIVLRKNLRTFKPRLTVDVCIQIEQLYGSVTKPLENVMTSLSDVVFIIALSLQQYNLSEDELYELFDELENPLQIVFKLYESAGLINTQQDEQNPVDAEKTPNNEEINNEPQTFEEMCNDMLIQCLAIGLSREEFFNSTLKEVTQYVEAYKKQQQNKLEEQAFFSWQTANLIGMSVARLMSKDAKFPKLEEAYPFVNGTEDKPKDDKGLTTEEQLVSAQLVEWAYAMRDKQKRKKEREQKAQETLKEDRVE